MFKVESYITPLLMGYLDKYVKLRQEDFQLSLWGGDAVLNNLDLRLDELEKVLQLPVMFQSGHIHELRLHVPWTKLGSEPVVITINTVECILKVRDTAYEGGSSSQAKSSSGKSLQSRQKSKKRPQPVEDLPPGYLQTIVNRIINNVTFIINNFILKFVEDDIVISVNIKSAECYSVDREWNRAFVDLAPDDLALRKVLNFADLTVCLDKTNSSGHIESYQEPMAYRCAVTCRLHMEYESISAKLPNVTRLNVFCDTLNLSLTDTQLPLFVRFIELCIAMYYGSLDIPDSVTGSTSEEQQNSQQTEVDGETTDIDTNQNIDQSSQGWASWAWSYVPQILPTEEEQAELDRQMEEQGRRGKPPPLILSIGFYIHRGTIVFKMTEKSKESSELPHKKMYFHPFLKLCVDGLGLEVLLQGVNFCSVQCGITSLKLTTCGNCICDVNDEKTARCNILLSGGEDLDNKIGLNYISNSLFDDVSWENRGQRAQHVVDGEEHRQIFTDQYALQRFGAFWVDSLYIYEQHEKPGASSNSSDSDSSELLFLKEFSTLRFVFGNTHLHCSSTLYHRISKLVHCATNHQYQPYGSSKQSSATTPEERPKPTEEQVKSLEEFIPTTLLHMMFIKPTVTLLQAEHPYCDVTKKNYKCRQKKRDTKTPEENHQLPPIAAVVLSASRFDLQITRPMYPGRLVKLVTAIAGPSSNLLHHSHSHMQIKLFSLQAGLQRCNGDGTVSRPLTLLPPCSFALYLRSLVLPKLWTNSSLPLREWMYEIPNASININKASVLLCTRVISSWLSLNEPIGSEHTLNDSLLDDLFPVSGESTQQNYPLLELGLSGLEFKSCDSALVTACVGSLSLIHIFLYTPGIGGKMSVIPILYGPSDTSKICSPDFFREATLDKTEVRCDCITATFQKPKHAGASEAQALALVDCQGLCAWLDPGLISWFHYCPQPRIGLKAEPVTVTLDLSLAQMTSPLNAVSQASVRSTSSPSHPGLSRQQTSVSQPPQGRQTSCSEEIEAADVQSESLGKLFAYYFPLVRMLHLQLELKPCAVFLPKTGVPNSESSSDILTIVHQARQAGRLSDTLVLCVPSIAVTSTMTKPMSVAQELPVRSIQGSLIGEKLPWSIKINNICVYSLLSSRPDPQFLVHPMDIVSTVAVTCKYNPPTSENISNMAICLHVDVGQPQLDITPSQLHLCATVFEMMANVVSNTDKLLSDCLKLFASKGQQLLPSAKPGHSLKKSTSSVHKIESIRSAEVTENPGTEMSEDFSHEGSPLHENIIEDKLDVGVKLSLWLQLMFPRLQFTLYSTCPLTHREHGLLFVLEHFDLSMDSQSVYSKAKVTLGSVSVQHSVKSADGTWNWTDPDGIVLSFTRQLPTNLHLVSNKMWVSDTAATSTQPHDPANKDKKHGVLSVTLTRALCKNVKKRLRKANVELPSVTEVDLTEPSLTENTSSLKVENIDFCYHQYLSEICVKAEPFDVVLKQDVIHLVVNLFSGLSKGEKRDNRRQPSPVKPDFPAHSSGTSSKYASVHNLPLVYADLGVIRVFVPCSNNPPATPPLPTQADQSDKTPPNDSADSVYIDIDSAGLGGQSSEDSTQSSAAPKLTGKKHVSGVGEASSTLNHNMLVLQVQSCLLQPHADNPLPRTAQEKEVYLYAVQSGLTHQPGSIIEDRQYQLDVKGVSCSSGVWEDLVNEVKQGKLQKPATGSMVQFPALEWNTFLMDSVSQKNKDIRLVPLAAPCDFCLVVAPPITYTPQCEEQDLVRTTKLICGYTAELNVTSDLDLYISTNQIQLLSEVTAQFTKSLSSRPDLAASQTLTASPSPLLPREAKKTRLQQVEAAVDSGVESDLSTLTLDRGQLAPAVQHLLIPGVQKTEGQRALTEAHNHNVMTKGGSPPAMVPVDVLVTASRISCTVYTHKILEESVTLEMPLFRDNQSHHAREEKSEVRDCTPDNLEAILRKGVKDVNMVEVEGSRRESETEGSEHHVEITEETKSYYEDSIRKVIPEGSTCIIPFAYVYITQPHCLLASHSTRELRLEASCYDVLVKGASDKHVSPIDDYHTIPDCTDFNVHWLETRPGQPHPYTGIPPSLLTVRFTKDSSNPDTVSTQIERPLCMKVSQLAVEQISSFTSQLLEMLAHDVEEMKPEHKGAEVKVSQTRQHSGVLSLAERFELRSAQLVVVVEMGDSVGVTGSVEGMTLEADVRKLTSDAHPSFDGHLQLKDVLVKTSYERKSRQVIGPFSLNSDAVLTWVPTGRDHYFPQVLFVVETNLILATFGQEHLFCISEFIQQVNKLTQKLIGSNNVMKPKETTRDHKLQKVAPDFVQDRSHDDLRSGGFQFIEGPDNSSVLPSPNEIIFSQGNPDTCDNSSMTWCYPHPRVLTAIHLIPVPFYLSASTQSLNSSTTAASTVPCVLQYWDELRDDFISVVTFHLSENEAVTVDLPDTRLVNAHELVAAKTWRVVLQEEGLKKDSRDVAVLPTSLAACMCVDSAFIPSIIPALKFSITIPELEVQLCHHLKYNGTEPPRKLSLYQMSPDICDQLVFARVNLLNTTATMSHITGRESKSSFKLSTKASLDILEHGHLTMDKVLGPAELSLTSCVSTAGHKLDVNGLLHSEKVKVKVGKSAVHTLNMAVAAWSHFTPTSSGPLIIFSHYIICNNTTSAIRFGQAGTDENILLNSREMYGYSWRSYTCPQLLHLCMDKPTWKWTDPFSIDKEGPSVQSVTARDQSYVVILRVKRLSGLQLQITVCGQLVVCNRLSQAVSMRFSQSGVPSNSASKSRSTSSGLAESYVINPGDHLPSITSNEALLNPVQFRLAGFSASWSHDIFLSGDRMKDNQMIKIALPDGTSYFHVWCRIFCQHFYSIHQKLGTYGTATLKMIMLTPLYVVRTHLPRPLFIHLNSPKQSQEMLVKSEGREFQLHCTGGDITHLMSFRLGAEMQLSDPAVVLSTGLIGQLTRAVVNTIDIENLCEQKVDIVQQQWPYLTKEEEKDLEIDSTSAIHQLCPFDPGAKTTPASDEDALEPQPSIDLNIRLSEYIPGCDTLLVEVAPTFLVHNATDLEVLISGVEGRQWGIRPNHTMAPPLLKGEFTLAIKNQNCLSEEKKIPMSSESQDYRRYNDDIGKVLFIDGYVHVSFTLTLEESNQKQLVFITVTSEICHDIRVVCIREHFALTNETDLDLGVRLLALPLSLVPVKMAAIDPLVLTCAGIQGDKSGRKVSQSLLKWSTIRGEKSDDVEIEDNAGDATYVCYLSFSKLMEQGSSDWTWSLPVRIVSSKDGHRTTTSIPDQHRGEEADITPITHPITVATQLLKGVTHVVLKTDPAPACVVENLCPFPLQYGQACDKLLVNGAVIQEQVELVADLPWLPPGGWSHYTPPSVNTEFVNRDTLTLPRLHFRAMDVQVSSVAEPGFSEWSSATQISGNMDAFVRLPGFCDLKVMIEVVGMVTHLIIRPVSKAEITAKEIRTRLTDHGTVKTQTEKSGKFGAAMVTWETPVPEANSIATDLPLTESTSVSSPSQLTQPRHPLPSSFIRFTERTKRAIKDASISITLGISCSSFSLVLQDESSAEVLTELTSLHFKDLFFAVYPVSKNPEAVGQETSYTFSASTVQLDNMQYGEGMYDFPVVILPQKSASDTTTQAEVLNTEHMSVLELHAVLRSRAFLHLQIVTYSDPIWHQFVIETVDVSVKPLSLYIDDSFIYRLVQELENFSPSRLSGRVEAMVPAPGRLDRKLPAVIRLNCYTLSHPIRIKHFTVQPINLLLSVHASLKLFLASDHTPLNVGKFERVQVFSTTQKLGHALAMHYASAAIFRAGIMVGSLEILGNPTGLVRSIGTGVSDLISLPYYGLTRGPGAFVSGLSRGIGSLVKNVSAGMITSVTNFASSVSRNMDRLSFDSSHLERQEENRRNRPVGVSDGLKQGLTGFGLSLLGAVAGLADQPMQTLLSTGAPDERRGSASSTASGFVTGMGKGLVGVFTKPIGGAAEFVSQTGQGILHGTGLGQLPARLDKASVLERCQLPDGQFKYSIKIFSSLPSPELLLAVPALTFDLMETEVKVVLILTPDVLVVVNVEEDAQQQALALTELECKPNYEEDGRLILQWKDQIYGASSLEQSRTSNKDRVAAFIDTQKVSEKPSAPACAENEPILPANGQSEVPAPSLQMSRLSSSASLTDQKTSSVSSQIISAPQYEFEMDPHWHDLFVTLFQMAKNRLQGRGFPL